jgi:predicted amidophosphoribosyltransferase
VRECASCRGQVEERYRFCPWCAAPLRVSRYLAEEKERRHVRFSVWNSGGQTPRAQAAVSLTEEEAARLSAFLAERIDASEAETLV